MPRPKRHVKWARGDWILFIQMYKKHNCLWDTKKPASQQEIKDALQDLKQYFRINIKDLTITDIKMRIKELKNKYAREKKRVEFLKKNDIPVFLKPWFRVADGFLSDEPIRLNETEIKIPIYQRTNRWEQKKKLETDAAVSDNNGKNEVVPNISAKIEESDLQTLDITKIWEKKVINTYQKPKSNRKEAPKNHNVLNVFTEVGKQNETTEVARMQFKKKDKEVFGQEIIKNTRDDSFEEQAELQYLKLYKQHICLWNMNYRHNVAVQRAYSDIIDRMEQWGKPGMTRKDIDRIEARIKCGYLKEKKQIRFLREKGYTESIIIVPLWYDFAKEFFETHEITSGIFNKCVQQNLRQTTDTAEICSDDGWKLFTKFVAEELRQIPHAEALNLQSDIMTMVANFKRRLCHKNADFNTTHLLNTEFDHSDPSNTKEDKSRSLLIVKQGKEETINLQSDAMSMSAIGQGCANVNSSPPCLHLAASTESKDGILSMIKKEKEDIRDDNLLNTSIKKYKRIKCEGEELQATTVAKSEANVPATESREMFILTEPKNELPEHLDRNQSMDNQIECVQANKSTKEETNTVIETVQNEETQVVDNKMNNEYIPTNGKPPTWDRQSTIKIIQLLKEHKCLWYKSACPITRAAAILDIVTRLKIPGLTPEHVERKITSIKCSYRKERIKYLGTINKFFFPKIYWYDLVDDFLRPYCKIPGTFLSSREVIDKRQPVVSGSIKYINQYSKTYKSLNPSETTIDINFGSMGSYEPEEASVQETPQKMVIATPKPIEDEFYLFANSLVTELRDMPNNHASTLQSDIKSMIIRRKWFLKQGYTTLNNSYGSIFFDPGPTKFSLNSGDNKEVHELLLPTVKIGSVVNTQDQDYPIADTVKVEEEEEMVLGS